MFSMSSFSSHGREARLRGKGCMQTPCPSTFVCPLEVQSISLPTDLKGLRNLQWAFGRALCLLSHHFHLLWRNFCYMPGKSMLNLGVWQVAKNKNSHFSSLEMDSSKRNNACPGHSHVRCVGGSGRNGAVCVCLDQMGSDCPGCSCAKNWILVCRAVLGHSAVCSAGGCWMSA